MFGDAFAYLGIKTLDDLLEYTLAEYTTMLNAVKEKNKRDKELEFMILKRAITESLNGKHKPLFGNDNVMTREENHKKFEDLVNSFKKGVK